MNLPLCISSSLQSAVEHCQSGIPLRLSSHPVPAYLCRLLADRHAFLDNSLHIMLYG